MLVELDFNKPLSLELWYHSACVKVGFSERITLAGLTDNISNCFELLLPAKGAAAGLVLPVVVTQLLP